jgi:calmodulin
VKRKAMAKVFNIFDRDRDGSITIDDVEQVMNLLSKDLQAEIEMPAIDQIKVAFEKFDENQNGTIEFEEFLNILKSAALQSPSSNTITSTTNKKRANPIATTIKSTKSIATNTTNFNNENNTITLNGHGILSNMKLMFEQFDKDNDGRITKNELNFVMCNLFPDEAITEQDINDMLKAADLDNNGYIDFEEFAVMFSVFNGNPQLRNNSYEPPLRNDFNQPREEFTATYSPVVRLKNQKNSITTSNKSLNKSSRSNSKDSRTRTRSSSQANSAAQSPANFRKVVQIFTSSQMMDLKAAFTMFDKNGDQKISGSELKEVMHYLGLKTSEDEVKAMIQVVDKNRNGYVDYDEFIQMMTQTQIKPLNADEELKKTFNIFDIDGNGYICHDEIKKTMEHLGESVTDEEVNDMIKAADKNGDGRIDINEFSGLLNGVTSRK